MTTTTPPTIGLIGASGLLGRDLLAALLAQNLPVVVLHRPTSTPPSAPNISSRALDITAPHAEIHAALAGIDILINATSATAPAADTHFLAALASAPSPPRYIPSDFSLPYTPTEAASIPLIAAKEALIAQARALGIRVTALRNGVFEPFALSPFVGVDLDGARLALVPGAEGHVLPITSPRYLAAAVAEIVQLPEPDESYTVVEYIATGAEIAAAIEEVTGKRVDVSPWGTEEELSGARETPLGALSAAVRVKWGSGGWDAQAGGYVPKAERGDIRAAVCAAVQAAGAAEAGP